MHFEAQIIQVNSRIIVKLPEAVSKAFPSRGMNMAKGTINGISFRTPLEPDGKGSHWFRLNKELLDEGKIRTGDAVIINIEPSEKWPDPELPADLKEEIAKHSILQNRWADITIKARWDWFRWIRSTRNSETRQRRIEVLIDKLKKGDKRPCCFNRNLCTDMDVSHSGHLMEPSQESGK